MEYVVGEILVWLLVALFLGGVLAVLWMRLVTGARDDTRLAPLQDRVAELESERDLLRREVGEARDRSTERETQLSALRDDLEAREAKIIGQAAELEKLREMRNTQTAPAGDSADVEALRAELDGMRQHLAERDAQLAELNAELANAREAYHHLEAAQFGIAPTPSPAPAADSPNPDQATEAKPPAAEPLADASAPPAAALEPAPEPAADAAETVEPSPPPESPPPPAEPRRRHAQAGLQGGTADDLTRIRGIGKVLEDKLNALGVNSYAQIAAFSPDDVARVGAQLTPKGRIERDGWIDQARALLAERQADTG